MKRHNKLILAASAALLLSPLLASCEAGNTVKDEGRPLVRTDVGTSYSDGFDFNSFVDPRIEEDDDSVVFTGRKEYSPSYFDEFDLVSGGLWDRDGYDVDFRARYLKKTKTMKVTAEFTNFSVNVVEETTYLNGQKTETEINGIETIEGLVTYNLKGERDVLFADRDGDVWLSDIEQTLIDETGFWDWVASVVEVLQETAEAVTERVVEIATAIFNEVVSAINAVLAAIGSEKDAVKMLMDAFDALVEALGEGQTNTIVRNLENAARTIYEKLGPDACGAVFSMFREPFEHLVLGSDGSYHPRTDSVFHASQVCWQAAAGYSDLYDAVFHVGTGSIPEKWLFYDSNNNGKKDYILWAWKGNYWSFGYGAELGIYRRLNDSEHFIVDPSLALPISMEVYYDDEAYPFASWDNRGDASWWMTAFNPAYNLSAFGDTEFNVNKIHADYVIDFDNWNATDSKGVSSDTLKAAFLERNQDPSNENKRWEEDAEGKYYYVF